MEILYKKSYRERATSFFNSRYLTWGQFLTLTKKAFLRRARSFSKNKFIPWRHFYFERSALTYPSMDWVVCYYWKSVKQHLWKKMRLPFIFEKLSQSQEIFSRKASQSGKNFICSVVFVFCFRFSRVLISFWYSTSSLRQGIFNVNGMCFPFCWCGNLFLPEVKRRHLWKEVCPPFRFEMLSQSQDTFSWKTMLNYWC